MLRLVKVLVIAVLLQGQIPSYVRTITGQVDAERIMAHIDTVRHQTGIYFPYSAGLAISWMETRSGSSGNSARGPGIWKSRLTHRICTEESPCSIGDSINVCREVGRMQLNPCINYTSLDQRCTYLGIKTSLDTNIHCGMLWEVSKIKACDGDLECGIEHYNGNGCTVVKGKRWCSKDYLKDAKAYVGMLYLKGWQE